jgi:ketosteroid isomerase-like protein
LNVNEADRNRELVRGVYQALFDGDVAVFKDATHDDFVTYVTPVVRWGGVHHGAEAILTNVLPPLAAVIDFASLRLISVSSDGDNVAALLSARSLGDEEIWLAEHWTVRDGKIAQLRAFYFDARPIASSPTPAAL